MTVAATAFTVLGSGTGDISASHTPSGTPRFVQVYIAQDGGTDDVSGVTYGGVAMTENTGSPNLVAGGETGGAYSYFLGASIPTGTQTVTVTMLGGGLPKIAYCISGTAAADCETVDSDASINSTSVADPSCVLSLGGRSCFCSLVFWSGHDSTGSVTPLTGWTAQNELDIGVETAGIYTYDTVGTTDVTAGWTQTANDAAAMCLAISEVSAGGARPVKMAGHWGGYAGSSGGFVG